MENLHEEIEIQHSFSKDLGEHEEEAASAFHSRAFLYLYFTKDNLNKGYLHGIKSYLIRLVNSIRKMLVISVNFSDEVLQDHDFENDLGAIQQVLNAVYNIFEPEYSKQFPMVIITITIPQVFKTSVIPTTIKFDVFFFDSEIVSKSQYQAVISQSNVSSEVRTNDLKETRELDIKIEDMSEEEKGQSLITSNDDVNKSGKFEHKMTCLGGTFDHLHLGHKLLLTNACFYTSETIIIGITSSELLNKKKWAHFIEDFETRKSRVHSFINILTDGRVTAKIYELNDPCGPAGTIEEIEALILTAEVAKGGDYCNGIREKNGLNKCKLIFVDMILNEKEDSGESSFSNKTSSSYIRQYLDKKTGHKAEELYTRFMNLWDTISLPQEQKGKWWTILRDSYCTHWRYYFNLYHIYSILEQFDLHYDPEIYKEENRILVELAIWFHRIVFLPLNIDQPYNVQQSFMILEKFVESSNIDETSLSLIKSLIMSVHRHRQKEELDDPIHDKVNKFFLDIILVFLGFEGEEYEKYRERVRRDYLWVEKEEYRQKRMVILQRLLDRERIYITDHMYDKFEKKARDNLQHEIDESSPKVSN